jgi:uroporphyrinogen-III synthase
MATMRTYNKHGQIFSVEVVVRKTKLSPRQIGILKRSALYDWIFFTSAHAVELYVVMLQKHRIPLPLHLPVAAVGTRTKAKAEAYGFTVGVVPKVERGDMLARAWIHHMRSGRSQKCSERILFPRSVLSHPKTIHLLRHAGATVMPVVLYDVVPEKLSPKRKRAFLTGVFAHLYFKSPSAVRGFMMQFSSRERILIRQYHALCIGSTTSNAARNAGFTKVTIQKHS